jgi:lipoprotein-releasing system ATP-binding protein
MNELEARGLVKQYEMGRSNLVVLHDCDLLIPRGSFTAIMGKSGSGKSTLLHILGALDVPQEGQVFFDGQPIFAPPAQRRHTTGIGDVLSPVERRRIRLRRTAFGFVFQFYHLLPELNVLENVLLARMIGESTWRWLSARAEARRDALAILQRVGLEQRLRHRPAELSGGERQRVAVARALVHRPRVLFADEPTGNLDAEAGANIMQLLRTLHREGQTIVMVTHDAQIAQYADRVLRLEDGRLTAAHRGENTSAPTAPGPSPPIST